MHTPATNGRTGLIAGGNPRHSASLARTSSTASTSFACPVRARAAGGDVVGGRASTGTAYFRAMPGMRARIASMPASSETPWKS